MMDEISPPSAGLHICDTRYFQSRDASRNFREELYRHWGEHDALEFQTPFEARLETRVMEQGLITKMMVTPSAVRRSKPHILRQQEHCLLANFILHGQMSNEQNGRDNIVRAGDLLLIDPSYSQVCKSSGHHSLTFLIPKAQITVLKHAEQHFNNVVLNRAQLPSPLVSCLAHLADNMCSASADEVNALFGACTLLLQFVAIRSSLPASEQGVPNYVLREIMSFVSRNIADSHLSPRRAAEHAGVSVRYLHTLFASTGTTFSSYVLAKRLDNVRTDLLSEGPRRQISAVAYKWGFNDLSAFHRAFKQRFGRSPGAFRSGR